MVPVFENAVATGRVDQNPEDMVQTQQAGDSENTHAQSMDIILHNAERVANEVTSPYYDEFRVEGGEGMARTGLVASSPNTWRVSDRRISTNIA